MTISIRNPRAEELAKEISAISGENMTQTIIHALEEKLERMKGKKTPENLNDALMEISMRCRDLPDLDKRSADEILEYNEHGAL